jgi:hypothetical protein
MFLANPYLEYLDITETGLTNHGLFYLLLELAYSDPLQKPSGPKHLRQLAIGPPADSHDYVNGEGQLHGYVSTVFDALADVHNQSPSLRLVSLVNSLHSRSAISTVSLRDFWTKLDPHNTVEQGSFNQKSCVFLRSGCVANVSHCK